MKINTIYNENCIDTISKMPDNFLDLVVTSPPYDNLRKYSSTSFCESDWREIISALFRVTKQGGVVVWIVNDATINGSETGTSFKQALHFMDCGFNLHDTMIWQKSGVVYPGTARYYASFEYMFVFSKGKPKTFNQIKDVKNKNVGQIISHQSYRQKDDKLKTAKNVIVKEFSARRNIWFFPTGWGKSYKDSYLKIHPAIMPVDLVADHLISWSNENDLVYDPFMGSGTTAIACIRQKRSFIGSEISKEYFELSQKRIRIENNGGLL